MFKSKYGLIAVVLVLIFGAISVFWARSSVGSKVDVAAVEKLNESDALIRYVEKANEGMTVSLATSAAMEISDLYIKYTASQKELEGIMSVQLQQLADAGEVPVFVAVLGNPTGTKQHMSIHWMAVNGTDVTQKLKDQWISSELLDSLAATPPRVFKASPAPPPAAPGAAAPAKGNKPAKRATNAHDPKDESAAGAAITIPLQPGETKGKYNVKPAIYQHLAMKGVKIPLGVKVVKNYRKVKKDVYSPVEEGVLLMGFAKTPLDRAALLVMRAGRDRRLETVMARLNALQKKLFAQATAFFTSPKYGIEGMTPHVAVLTNAHGVVITRDRDDSKLRGYNYLRNGIGRMHIIGEAVKTRSTAFDILTYEVINRYQKKEKPLNLFQAAAIPIRGASGAIIGVFTMAWPFDVRGIQMKHISDVTFAYFYGQHMFTPSLTGTKEIKALADAFNGRYGSVKTSPRLNNAKITGERLKIGGESYLGAHYRYATPTLGGEKYGYIVLVSTDSISRPAKGFVTLIIAFGIFVILLMLIIENLVFHYFYKSIDAIDEGVQEVAAGDMEFVFGRVSAETEGLANSLNEMLNVLFGRESLDEEGGDAPVKTGIQLLSLGPIPEMPLLGDDERVEKYKEMTDQDFQHVLYEQFIKAWEEFGEESPVPSQDLFAQRVKLFERMVLRQLECSRVFFGLKVTEEAIEVLPLPIS